MLRFLFPRLTIEPARGSALFDAVVREARRPEWFTEGGMADDIDGRFALLATVTALTTVRLERGGEAGPPLAVALAERFIEAMDSEHRQLGLGDPTLGRTVRKLTAGLGRRVELWRRAVEEADWTAAARESLHRRAQPEAEELERGEALAKALWRRLEGSSDEALAEGRIA